jgi:hypothetical protein
MQVKFQASDLSNSGNWMDAAIDIFRIDEGLATGNTTLNSLTNCCEVYPNPFINESVLHFDFGNAEVAGATLEIQNILGQMVKVYSISSQKGTIQWGADLTEGVYLLKIVLNGETATTLIAVKTR